MTINSDIVTASTRLFVDSNEAIQILLQVREINRESWKMTTADAVKIEESIKQLAKAQAILRKVREKATISLA